MSPPVAPFERLVGWAVVVLVMLSVAAPRLFSHAATIEADETRIGDLIAAFMEGHDIPALSIAIAREGRLVFARGYGHADSSAEVPVNPEHLFRIASVSKPITAAAVMRLVEEGRLELDQLVFGDGALLGTRFGTPPYRDGIEAITVEHLLTHTAGGWPNNSGDPMFRAPHLDHAGLIGWVLDAFDVQPPPGNQYAYSNFGYCVLGRVIEAVHGKPYEESVRELVLAPAGARDMHIAGNRPSDRRENEVVYLQPGDDAYRFDISRMDAHGGWAASPTDLLRFVVRVDGFDTVPDLLKPETIRTMAVPSDANVSYAKGWKVNDAGNWWHTGSLPGTGAILVRAQNGFCWAVLTNRRARGTFHRDLDRLTWDILHAVDGWPEGEPL